MPSLARITLRFLLVAVALVGVARAATSVCHEGYTICTWRIEDGLPQSTVSAIAQTRDGYLWVGTLNGLARFDGVRFQVFDHFNTPGLRDGRIAALFESHDGTLWIGHDSGAVTRYRTGRFAPVTRSNSPGHAVLRIGQDAAGTIWVLGTSGTLESIDGPPPARDARGRAAASLLAFAQGEDRRLWFGVDGALHELRDGRLAAVDLGAARESDFVFGIGPARGGGIWVVRDGRVRIWDNGDWDPQRPGYVWPRSVVTRLVERRSGGLAAGTMTNGLYLLLSDGREINFDHRNSGLQNWVRIVYEDREGNLWIGAGSGGLSMVRASGIAVLNPPDDWQGRTTLTIAAGPDNSLWVGTEGAGLYRRHNDRWTRFGEEHGLRNPFVWALAPDASGRMFAGTWSSGLFRQEGERFLPVEGIGPFAAPVMALQLTMDHRTQWIATGAGLLRLVDGRPAGMLREPGQAETFVSAVERDAHGVLWAALPERGLARVTDDALLVLGRKAGLASDSAQCLLADGDTLWIGTRDAGLSRLRDGKFASIDRARGLVSNVICHIADDQRGNLWISTHRGIMRIAKSELHRCADGALAEVGGRVFDKSDGLPTLEFSGGLQGSGCRTPDGRLWFTSNKGVVSFDPAAISANATPPPVVVESLDVDGTEIATATEPRPVRLAPNHNRLEFHFTALTLTASSKAQFKHRLVGLDRDWIDAGPKRSAVYSQLPRGDYEFQVIAANEDRVWNLSGAMLRFSVLPFYWQTWWFRGASALAALSAVAWLARFVTRRRMQRRVRELEYERGIERERARIAQDIHDDIGSSLTRISMLSQTARGELEQPRRALTLLERIHATALEVTAALDEIVWAVNPRHDTLDSLVSYMAKFAQETLAAAQVRCRLDLPADLPGWPLNTHTRHNLILAFKEAVHNALKHSGATEVRVSLTLHPDQFIVAVEDNGRGFDSASVLAASTAPAAGNSGDGIHNFQRRLAQIGGRCEIHAAAGKGTRVRFVVGYHP